MRHLGMQAGESIIAIVAAACEEPVGVEARCRKRQSGATAAGRASMGEQRLTIEL